MLMACFSDTKISDTVLNMPDTVAPRPPRRVNYCLPCVKKLSTTVKGDRRVAAGYIISVITLVLSTTLTILIKETITITISLPSLTVC